MLNLSVPCETGQWSSLQSKKETNERKYIFEDCEIWVSLSEL